MIPLSHISAPSPRPVTLPTGSPQFSRLRSRVYQGGRSALHATVNSIEWVDKTPIRHLLLAGLLGMTTPRVILEWVERGKDMVIETLFREVTGDISMVFLSGLMGSVVASIASWKAIQNKISRAYPHINIDWKKHQINGKTLEVMGNQFISELEQGAAKGQTIQQVKENFVNNLFNRMRYARKDFTEHAIDGFYKNGQGLIQSVQPQPIIDSLKDGHLSSRLQGNLATTVLKANDDQAIEHVLKSLISEYALEQHNIESMTRGLKKAKTNADIDKIIKFFTGGNIKSERLNHIRKSLLDTKRKHAGFKNLFSNTSYSKALSETIEQVFRPKELLQEQTLSLGKKGKIHPIKRMIVDILHPTDSNAKAVMENVELKPFLQELETIVHQFINPSLKINGIKTSTTIVTPELAKKVRTYLAGPADQKMTFFKRLIPKKSKGLFNYMMSAKHWLTFIPMAIALSITIAEAFINNWLTKRRHNGKVFSPFLGGPIEYGKTASLFNSPLFKKPLHHTAPDQVFNQFMHPRRNLWVYPGQAAAASTAHQRSEERR